MVFVFLDFDRQLVPLSGPAAGPADDDGRRRLRVEVGVLTAAVGAGLQDGHAEARMRAHVQRLARPAANCSAAQIVDQSGSRACALVIVG